MTGTSTNISKRKRAEERAEYLATRDALTGLPNRVLLHDRLEQAVVQRRAQPRRLRRSCSSTWTASRRSTIRSATRWATSS